MLYGCGGTGFTGQAQLPPRRQYAAITADDITFVVWRDY